MIRREIFDLPCALKAPKSFDTVDCSRWKVSSLFMMSVLTHLGLRIKRSCLGIYGELVGKEFSFQFSRNCMTTSKRDRVFSAAEHLCAVISKPRAKLLSIEIDHRKAIRLIDNTR